MKASDYIDQDGLGLAELVRRKEVTPAEVLEAMLDRLAALNPKLGCVPLPAEEAARQQVAAGLPTGPLRGVPFLLKDLYTQLKGSPLTNGSRLFRDFVCPIDFTLTERYRAAGLVFAGRTTSPEFGLNMASDPVIFGQTRNPWNLGHTCGGSSGGAAAAVAAGIVPIAHATDGGGSIRIPASNCGVVGLKTTRARNPAGPMIGEGWASLSVGHVETRTVRDSAAVLDATHGPAEGDPYFCQPPERSFLAEVGRDPGRLRIALQTKPLSCVKVHAECVAAAENAAKLCESLGHTVVEGGPQYDHDALFEALWVLAAAGIAATVEARLQQLGRPLRDDDLEPATHALYRRGKETPIWHYTKCMTAVHMIGRRTAAFFRDVDVAISPVMANPPLPLGARPNMKEADWDTYANDLLQQLAFTPLYNVAGAPAMSVPLHWTAEGLPVGVQLGAAFGNEGVLFRLAAQLEAAQPWFHKRPPL
ncbi:MAG: amidase [Rhodospirillaceae bacterium]|nr:amidase [Rhodospirillaceae bacterium]